MKEIIEEKTGQFKEELRIRIDKFITELEKYAQQIEDYVSWGDIEELPKYRKKATALDNKYYILILNFIIAINMKQS